METLARDHLRLLEDLLTDHVCVYAWQDGKGFPDEAGEGARAAAARQEENTRYQPLKDEDPERSGFNPNRICNPYRMGFEFLTVRIPS